jgi:hypothetical protein
MSILSRLLSLEPIDEKIVQAIVDSVALRSAKIDVAALGADLAEAKWSSLRLEGPLSPRKQTSTQRKQRAATIRTHAAKLFAALGSAAEEAEARDELWRDLCGLQVDEQLPPLPLRVEAFAEFLDILQLLTRDADKALSAAGAEIQSVKEQKRIQDSNPAWARFVRLWSPPKTVTWTIAFELAPIFERHFKRKATAATPPTTAEIGRREARLSDSSRPSSSV